MPRIAIIGAGISGLTLAQELRAHAEVTVFEKARGVGGRMSTRYADPFYFDHGAQFFTARTAAFQKFLTPLIANGVVREWKPKLVGLRPGNDPYDRFWFEPHYVACPHMNALCKYLATNLEIRVGTEIAPMVRTADAWELHSTQREMLGTFDDVISTAPPAQTDRLFNGHIPAHAPLPSVQIKACYALMLGLSGPWNHHWQAATVDNSPIGWMALNTSKPGREQHGTSLILHATADWSEQKMESETAAVEQEMLSALGALIGPIPEIAYSALHRWRYALVENDTAHGPYHVPDLGMSAVGDWTSAAGRIEAAWQQSIKLSAIYKKRLGHIV